MKHLVIIDYGSGNLRSVAKAFERVAGGDWRILVSDRAAKVDDASHVVLPGVGAFADCMAGLAALPGMRDAMAEHAPHRQKPFLGICVGMQLMMQRGLEHGAHEGLGWFKGEAAPIDQTSGNDNPELNPETRHPAPGTRNLAPLKIPHMGWNNVHFTAPQHPLFKDIPEGAHAYFVHSFHARCSDPGDVLAQVEYGQPISAVIGRGNLLGTQFHPEKSQATGLTLLRNFLNL